MKISKCIILNIALTASSLFTADKVFLQATKFAIKQFNTAIDLTYKPMFFHELSHAITAIGLGKDVSSFKFGPSNGGIEYASHDGSFKENLIHIAGPVGGLGYLLTKSPALKKNKRIPYAIYSCCMLQQLLNLVPLYGLDGYKIASNINKISNLESFGYKMSGQEPFAHIAYPMMTAAILGSGVHLYKTKTQGHALFGKSGLALMPAIVATYFIGPKLSFTKYDEAWSFNLEK